MSHVVTTPLSCPVPPSMPPNSFFPRPRRTLTRILEVLRDPPRHARPPPSFLLNDFLESVRSEREVSLSGRCPRKAVLSNRNYRRLVDLLLSQLHYGHQRELASLTLSCEELPQAERRVPQWQIICGNTSFALINLNLQSCFAIAVCVSPDFSQK